MLFERSQFVSSLCSVLTESMKVMLVFFDNEVARGGHRHARIFEIDRHD